MSENQVTNVANSPEVKEYNNEEKNSIIKSDIVDLENQKSEKGTVENTMAEVAEDDLEDGEIDDDDENEEPVVMDSKPVAIVASAPTPVPIVSSKTISLPAKNAIVMDMINEMGKKSKSKSSKHSAVEADDFAGSIESAIAAALKKDGIMPPMPKILETREDPDKKGEKESSLSKSSRRRKRRKLRDDKEKEKKKHRASTPDTKSSVAIEEELDDDEMLCVRGGSPTPGGMLSILPPISTGVSSKKDLYDSDDSYTSYDSYDSGPSYQRYSSSRKKDSNTSSSSARSKRKERHRREDERRSEKRNRRNYDDSGGEDKYQDRHPQQPRKLELCKFYLMECCAKKDKCSYMHSDFPCKYYYLGMECVYRAACKFSHGKPLSDQLRNVLLKHLETAPKEILGTFRRISRDNALNLMMATHDKICQEHGIENTMAPQTNTTQSIVHTQAGIRNSDHSQQSSNQQQSEVIPSLLDMVIKGPLNPNDAQGNTNTTTSTALNQNKPEKQRKSRWCDSTSTNPNVNPSTIIKHQANLDPPSLNAPSYLDLKNLTGILSSDRIEKLSKFGVVNLEQINQLTLSQLNNIGLTINEISEIQLNARNMARLGVSGVGIHGDVATNNINTTSTTTLTTISTPSASLTSSQDVDMRFLPSCLSLTTTTITSSTVTADDSFAATGTSFDIPHNKSRSSPLSHTTIQSGSNASDSHEGSSTVSGIDYSQYLRDSNLGYDKNDILDDEKDEEQLVIDDQDLDGLEDNSQTHDAEIKDNSDNESKGSYGYSGINDLNETRLPTKINISDKIQNILKDPYTANMSEIVTPKENLSEKLNKSSDSKSYSKHYNDDIDDDEGKNFYGVNVKLKNQNTRDIDSREDYRDPRYKESSREEYRDPRYHHNPPELKDEYRDPRITSPSQSSSKKDSRGRSIHIRSDDDSDHDRSHLHSHSNTHSQSRSRSRSRSCSRSRSRSHSRSPTPSISHHHHRNPSDHFQTLYERPSMYDWTPKCLQEDQEYSRRNTKSDKDMRLAGFLDSSNSDIDLRLPFQPVKNIQIAKEIDGSMSSLMPIPYKVYELDIPTPKYSDLRQSFQSEDTADPRLRRILGLPELSNSKALAGLGRPSRPTIASPSSVESSSSPTRSERERISVTTQATIRGPRVDPRRAAAAAASVSGSPSVSLQAQAIQLPAGNPQQNIEIRLLLQKSEWYKNLNSKAKIMVNQQLALVSTELKRYHQDPSPNKVFDIQFILNNQNLQEILTCLGIYIDDNGQVAHVDNDNEGNNLMMSGGCGMGLGMGPGSGMEFGGSVNSMMMMNDPNMNVQQRMAMQNQMEFLRGPPPNMNNMMGSIGPVGGGGRAGQGMYGAPGNMMPPYGRNPRIGMGMSPGNGGVGFNPFAGNPGDNNNIGGGGGNMGDSNYCGINNPFSNFTPNGGNFNNQQMNRGNRNQNRQGGMMNNGNSRNQNRRMFKQNRRGGGGTGGGNNNAEASMGKSNNAGVGDMNDNASSMGGVSNSINQNTKVDDDVEESWDD